uniref:hypothetical protein n=1 Tax=Trichocoleus desertorum TaxID=1481672 RepID=UPI0025B39439|nr:hypothetical protein [Trichocoleus desertorum]
MKRVISSNKTSIRSKFSYRSLVAGLLIASGVFQLALPTLAQTAAGTTISNTATATYEDPNAPGVPINATSNTVVIKVAEIAGITATPSGIIDVNGGTIQPGDILNYNYTITNVGNDTTKIFIPSTATVAGPGTVSKVQYSVDGGTTYIDVPAGGVTTGSIAVGGTVLARAVVTVSGTATSGSSLAVLLGDTGPNDNTPLTQNQADITDTALAQEVRTVDNPDGTINEVAGAPANGEREASATQQTLIGALPVMVNGPSGVADAVGPSSNNDDFTNKTTFVAPGTDPAAAIDPGAVTFTNTVQNGSTTDPLTMSLLPTPPTTAASLPAGTLVTITSGTQTATYTYNGTTFTFTSGSGTTADGQAISATNPVEIANLAPGITANYQVTVDLPTGSLQLVGYPVPITAFVDTNNDGSITTGELQNTTIDQLYTGYLKLVKESRVLQGTGSAVPAADGTFSTTVKNAGAGNIIEYRITYTNVSSAPVGTGNVTLSANKVVITEDGTAGTNSWAKDNDGNGTVDTSSVPGTSVDATGTIIFTPDEATATKYVDTVNIPVAPNTSGTFTFQRKVN